MNKKESLVEHAKTFGAVMVFAIGVLMLVVNVINISQNNIAGRAFFLPLAVQGTVAPDLPDGTLITFKAGGRVIASAELKNDTYGYNPKVFFAMDDPKTAKIEGYVKGDRVRVLIEGILISEFSYFEGNPVQKDIIIPASKRAEVTNAAVQDELERRCEPDWQCGGWSDCLNSAQTRMCTDIKRCDKEEGKPPEERICTPTPSIEETAQLEQRSLWIILLNSFLVVLLTFLVVVFLVGLVKRTQREKR